MSEEILCDHCGEEILDGGYKYKGLLCCTSWGKGGSHAGGLIRSQLNVLCLIGDAAVPEKWLGRGGFFPARDGTF